MDEKALLEAIDRMMDKKLEPIGARLDVVERILGSVRESQMTVENVHYPRIAASLEGFKVSAEKNSEQDSRILTLENIVDRHDVEIAYLKAK